jgi:hypothetical protein
MSTMAETKRKRSRRSFTDDFRASAVRQDADEILGRRRLDERLAYGVGHFDEHEPGGLRRQRFPDRAAIGKRQRLQDVGDVGGVAM